MTRENKLALIIGFGLVLVVGILVSDHLSAASRQENAALQAEEASLTPGRLEDHRLLTPNYSSLDGSEGEGLRLRPGPMAGNQSNVGDGDSSAGRGPGAGQGPGTIHMPGPDQLNRQLPPPGGSGAAGGGNLPQSYRWHTIKHRETLAAIARREYGDEKLWRQLAQFNKDRVPNPDVVPTGVTIRLPSKEELLGITSTPTSPIRPGGESSAGGAAAGGPASGSGHRMYTVQPGESLSKVARKLLGSESRWREIVELNKDVITNPDSVAAGTVIRVPNS